MAGNKPLAGSADLAPLLGTLRQLISDARSRALRAVDVIQVQTCWQVGHHIVEFEQGGAARAVYGKRLLPLLAEQLTGEFGSGFDASNLRYMRLFYQAFPKRDALRHELSWTHYRTLLRVEGQAAREWYAREAISQNWSTRALERQIGVLYYERLLSSKDKALVATEATERIAPLAESPKDFLRDPYILDFLNLQDKTYQESTLEQAIIDNIQSFLLELGKGFAFVERQQRIRIGDEDFYLDLVFYNFKLKCFLLLDLKLGKLGHQDVGQMDTYVRLYDERIRGADDNPTIGLLLCSEKSEAVVKYSVLADQQQLFAAKYLPYLPSVEDLKRELERERERAMRQIEAGEGNKDKAP